MNRLMSLRRTAGVILLAGLAWTGAGAAPVKLAIVPGDPALLRISDLLTAELSAVPEIALLERDQVERVLREQSLTGGGRNAVQLGRMLGADGLVLLGLIRDGTNQLLGARLVALNPGVIAASIRTPWPMPDALGWAHWAADYLGARTSKLSVKANEAVPVSFVSMRSAVQSPLTETMERDVNALIIERLTHEPEFFVLERRRMDALQEEKLLAGAGTDSFWNGSYLLEGVLDRDGYSRQTMTISARLVPPGNGAPELIELSGDRENAAALANRLVERLREILRLKSSSSSWSPKAEALRYLEQAEWALKWELAADARSAADSAWALGERTLRCATARVNAYRMDAEPDTGGYQRKECLTSSSDPAELQAEIDSYIRKETRANGGRMVFFPNTNGVFFLIAPKRSQVSDISKARHLLELYQSAGPAIANEITSPTNAWFQLGVKVLSVAALTLKHHNIAPSTEKSAPERLAELREEARRTAAWLAESPAGHDTIWYRDRPMSYVEFHAEYARWSSQVDSGSWDSGIQSIQLCQLKWGQYWHERPEDFLALCRKLLANPVTRTFAQRYLLAKLTEAKGGPDTEWLVPRLAMRNVQERARVERLWADFRSELESLPPPSRNEWGAGQFATPYPSSRPQHPRGTSNTFSQSGTSNHPNEAITNALRSSRERWEAFRGSNGMRPVVPSSIPKTLEEKKAFLASTNMPKPGFSQFFLGTKFTELEARELQPLLLQYKSQLKSQLSPQLTNTVSFRHSLESELFQVQMLEARFDTLLAGGNKPALATFEQKKLLLASATSPKSGLVSSLLSTNFTETQARELQPLLEQYASRLKADLAAVDTNGVRFEKIQARSELRNVELLQSRLDVQLAATEAKNLPAPLVPRFIPMPMTRFKLTDEAEDFAVNDIPGQQLQAGRLWLDVRLEHSLVCYIPTDRSNFFSGVWTTTNRAMSAWLDLNKMSWQFLEYPATSNSALGKKELSEGGSQLRPGFKTSTLMDIAALSKDRLYLAGPGYLRQYDFRSKKWETTAAPWLSPPSLFPIGSQLYAANNDTLFALLDGSEQTRVLASCRRRPALSVLDALSSYRVASFVPGPGEKPRVIIGDGMSDLNWNVHTWKGGDWDPLIKATNQHRLHGIATGSDCTFLKVAPSGESVAIWILPNDGDAVEVGLAPPPRYSFETGLGFQPAAAKIPAPKPVWTVSRDMQLEHAAVAGSATNLFILTGCSQIASYDQGRPLAAEQNGSQARLLYCERGQDAPVSIPLKLIPPKPAQGERAAAWGVAGFPGNIRNWIAVDANWVLFGQSDVQGVWALPRAELDEVLDCERAKRATARFDKKNNTGPAQ